MSKRSAAFTYRGGVHVADTILSCDVSGSASDLVFVSHAQALGAPGAKKNVRRAGRQQVLVTDQTLTLLGRAGERLRDHALPAAFGRPFALGGIRLELFPSGHLPGAASVLCEVAGRRVLYAGTVLFGEGSLGGLVAETRAADVLCMDATFGSPKYSLPPRQESLAQVKRFVEDSVASKRAPVVLVRPYGPAMEVAALLTAAGFTLRGHRSIVGAATAFRVAGVPSPVIGRFTGDLGPSEVLLWPPEARDAAMLGSLPAPAFAFVSGFCLDAEIFARVRADIGIPLSNQSGFAELIAYIEATGAGEVALHRGFAEDFAVHLRTRGLNAYALGPPRQMELFRG